MTPGAAPLPWCLVLEVLLAALEKGITTPASPANACVKEKKAGGMQAGWG